MSISFIFFDNRIYFYKMDGGSLMLDSLYLDGFFLRPALNNALSIIHSSCPLVLRNSSAAHFSTASSVSASILITKAFFFVILV